MTEKPSQAREGEGSRTPNCHLESWTEAQVRDRDIRGKRSGIQIQSGVQWVVTGQYQFLSFGKRTIIMEGVIQGRHQMQVDRVSLPCLCNFSVNPKLVQS